jgi:hypothetical protein
MKEALAQIGPEFQAMHCRSSGKDTREESELMHGLERV